MKEYDMIKSRRAFRLGLSVCAGIMALLPLLSATPAIADGALLSGESTTLLRARESINDKNIYQAYEYLNMSVTNIDKEGRLSFYVGGWGRLDLGEQSTNKKENGDLQYGYLSYRAPKNNLIANLGRQFITEGIAAERVDGAYVRSDLGYGFGAAAFAGAPIVTETNSKGGDLVYGGRLSHSMPQYYTIGLSGLKANQGSDSYREEEGVDLWLHPLSQVEVVGRSSYNSITDGWMEHDYTLAYTPLDNLSVNVNYSGINYKDYFYHMTTNVFSQISASNPTGVIDPNEKVYTMGGSVSYTPIKALTLTANYKNYSYEIAGDANYYGGKVSFRLPGSFVAGCAVHRMDGDTDTLRYNEYRVFASKRLINFNFTADFFNVNYDTKIKGVGNAYTIIGAASYDVTPSLKIGADLDYSKNPSYDNEVAGLIKLTYAFDIRLGAEGRVK